MLNTTPLLFTKTLLWSLFYGIICSESRRSFRGCVTGYIAKAIINEDITFFTAHLLCAKIDVQSVASYHDCCVCVIERARHRNRIFPLCYVNSFGIIACVGGGMSRCVVHDYLFRLSFFVKSLESVFLSRSVAVEEICQISS